MRKIVGMTFMSDGTVAVRFAGGHEDLMEMDPQVFIRAMDAIPSSAPDASAALAPAADLSARSDVAPRSAQVVATARIAEAGAVYEQGGSEAVAVALLLDIEPVAAHATLRLSPDAIERIAAMLGAMPRRPRSN